MVLVVGDDAAEQRSLSRQLAAEGFGVVHASSDCFTRFVVDDMAQEDPRRADLVEVLKAADSAARLTNQLLAFSPRKPLQTVVLDLNAALTSVGRVLHRTLGERIELVILPAEESLCVMCDAGQFDQLIFNLAVNAKDAMPDGGAITLKLGRTAWDGSEGLGAGDYVELLVSDTGKVADSRGGGPCVRTVLYLEGRPHHGSGPRHLLRHRPAGGRIDHSAQSSHGRDALPRAPASRRGGSPPRTSARGGALRRSCGPWR
jgi:hypothetical protein